MIKVIRKGFKAWEFDDIFAAGVVSVVQTKNMCHCNCT